MSSYYLAPSLSKLRDEIDARWPKRDKASDGWIGDAAHSSRASQHNPNAWGAVTALDIDKDGISVPLVLKALIGDSRVWYVIHDRKMWSRTTGWSEQRYNGPNPHTSHIHVSLRQVREAEEDVRRWLPKVAEPERPKPPAVQPPETPAPPEDDMPLSPADLKAVREIVREELAAFLRAPIKLTSPGAVRVLGVASMPLQKLWEIGASNAADVSRKLENRDTGTTD